MAHIPPSSMQAGGPPPPPPGSTYTTQTYQVSPSQPGAQQCPQHCPTVLWIFGFLFLVGGITMFVIGIFAAGPILMFLAFALLIIGFGMHRRMRQQQTGGTTVVVQQPVPITTGTTHPTTMIYQQSGPTPGFYPQQNTPQGQVPYPHQQPYQQNVYQNQQQYPNQAPPYPVTPMNQAQPPVNPPIPPYAGEGPPPAYDDVVKK